ncbi:MAG: alpha/beta hydrolase [Chloroflexi bacterium]|nr:alpha/beta hydrolase [Chloroflexota bacterium]
MLSSTRRRRAHVRRPALSEPWQHYYQSQRLRLSYWTWGDAANPPLVLVHGGRDHARNWDRLAEAFRDDYHVIACDLRGHGDSEWAEGSHYPLTDHIPDLVALIDLVGGHAPVVAHSFGGAIALVTAGLFPEKVDRLIAMEGVGAGMEGLREVTPERIRDWVMKSRAMEDQTPRIYPSFRAAADRMREANKALSEEMADHLARWAAHAIDNGWVWKFDPWVRGRSPIDLRPAELTRIWAQITCPILHLQGERSHVRPSRFSEGPIDEMFQESRAHTIQGAGHWMHHDQLEETVRVMRDFLGTPVKEANDG